MGAPLLGNKGKPAISSVSKLSIVMAISSNRWEGAVPKIRQSSLWLEVVEETAAAAAVPLLAVEGA